MPLYEYRCEKCEHDFEKLIYQTDEEVFCPRCHGRVRKLMSAFTVEVPDEACAKLPRGERRELCTECRHGGSSCPL